MQGDDEAQGWFSSWKTKPSAGMAPLLGIHPRVSTVQSEGSTSWHGAFSPGQSGRGQPGDGHDADSTYPADGIALYPASTLQQRWGTRVGLF